MTHKLTALVQQDCRLLTVIHPQVPQQTIHAIANTYYPEIFYSPILSQTLTCPITEDRSHNIAILIACTKRER